MYDMHKAALWMSVCPCFRAFSLDMRMMFETFVDEACCIGISTGRTMFELQWVMLWF